MPRNFYEIGKERKGLRKEVLYDTGIPAHELSKQGTLTEGDFSTAVEEGNIADVADRMVVAEKTQKKLSRITELTEDAEEFSFRDTAQRKAYETDRKKDLVADGESVPASERELQKRRIFRELDVMSEFTEKQQRGEYLTRRHPNDPRLAEQLRRNARLEQSLAQRRATLEVDPDTRFIVREYELDRYNRELDTGRFVMTPSRRAYVERIETLVSLGKPILLEGHTGTGKSELARIAARELTEQDPEVVYCNPQTRVSDIFGKQTLRETEKGASVTETDYGPLSRAIKEGTLCILDEFNELDPRGRQMLKYLYNARPGDMVDIPGNGKIRMAEGFGLILTANLRSEKYREKGELEPQEARVFQDSTIRVDYLPKDELYDIALSALSDSHGNLMFTHREAEETLRRFTDAVADIQEAYVKAIPAAYGQDSDFAIQGRRKRPALEKYVLDTGMAVRLLQGFHIARMKYGTPLRSFIDQSLARTFEGDRVSEDDKKLAIFILAKHGFLQNQTLRNTLDLDYADGRLKPEIFPEIPEPALAPEASLETLSAEEVASLDPYGMRKVSVADAFAEFDIEPPTTEGEGAAGEMTRTEAHELFKENFLGPEALEKTFGFRLEAQDIPAIPFSKQELEEAAKRGEMLVLQQGALPDGTPLTGKLIHERFGTQQDGSKFLYDTNWYQNEDFFTQEVPRNGWVLVSKEAVAGTKNQNYLDQTETLVRHIEKDIFPTMSPTRREVYKRAIATYRNQKPTIEALWQDYEKNWKDIARILSELDITKLSRESAVEIWYRMKLANSVRKARDKNILSSEYSWAHSRSSAGGLVRVGLFDSGGVRVLWNDPRFHFGSLGVAFFRSA